MTWLIMTMVICISGLMFYFLNALDEKSVKDTYDRVDIAFNIEKNELSHLNIEYSFWDQAYDKTVKNPDPKWIDEVYVKYILPDYDLDLIAVIHADKTVELLAQRGKTSNKTNIQSLLSSAILNKFNMIENEDLASLHKSFFTKFNHNIYLVSSEPFLDETTENIVDGTQLVLAKEISQSYLTNFENKYKLPKLSIDEISGYDVSYLLRGNQQETTIATLYWKVEKSTTQIIPYLVIILTVFLFFTLVVARRILKKDLKNIALYQEKLFVAATSDTLTNIANRRYYSELAAREFQLHIMNHDPMTVLALDIDHFKLINDQYGHPIGDAALKHFVNVCEENIRSSDIFARMGGEEFSILLRNTDQNVATEMANRIRKVVSESPCNEGNVTLNLTVSIGIATLSNQTSFDELLADADRALYAAKNSGRNTVETFN